MFSKKKIKDLTPKTDSGTGNIFATEFPSIESNKEANSRTTFFKKTTTTSSSQGNGPAKVTITETVYDSSLPNAAPITTIKSNVINNPRTFFPLFNKPKNASITTEKKYESPYRKSNTADKASNSYESPYKNRYPEAFKNIEKPTSPSVKNKWFNFGSKVATPPPAQSSKQINGPTKWINPTQVKVQPKKYGPGKLYIFHHDQFQNPNNEYREGSKADVKLLEDTFQRFKIIATVFDNLSLKQLRITVEKLAKTDFTRNSSITFVILSHGGRMDTISAHDGTYSIDDDVLFPILQNKTLQKKPKIFIVQACKGNIDLRGCQTDGCKTPQVIPDEIYKFYSTTEGFVSYRLSTGSLFIRSFCEEFRKFGSIRNIKVIMESVTKIMNEETK